MKKGYIYIILALIGTMCLACKGTKAKQEVPEMMVFTAAGLTNVMGELRDSFEATHHVKINLNLASSGTLARQIEQGEAPDLYVSASPKWAAYVDSLDHTNIREKQIIAFNDLALIAPLTSTVTKADLGEAFNITKFLDGSFFALGNPDHVPAGKYAKQSLEYYGLYKILDSQLLKTKDVRSALMMVELEEATLGLVYYTDAIQSEKVKVITTMPAESYTQIQFVASLCNEKTISKQFMDFISSDISDSIWIKYGFKR